MELKYRFLYLKRKVSIVRPAQHSMITTCYLYTMSKPPLSGPPFLQKFIGSLGCSHWLCSGRQMNIMHIEIATVDPVIFETLYFH